MRRRRLTVFFALVLAIAAAFTGCPHASSQEKPEDAAARAREAAAFQSRVDEAIARGARWLLRKRGRKADYGSLPAEGALNTFDFPSGLTALAYFTLLTTGHKPTEPAMRAIYRRLSRRHARPTTTYETAVLLMGIDARYAETATGTPRDPVPPEKDTS